MTLVLGGARSGKSTYALELARLWSKDTQLGEVPVFFVATAVAFDDEMTSRIKVHQGERPPEWITLEAPHDVGQAISKLPQAASVIVVDCLTLLANNVILALPDPENASMAQSALDAEVEALLRVAHQSDSKWIIVSNEVGLGLVPAYPLGRVYRDVLGRANQQLAQAADQVVLMVAGIPMMVKESPIV